MAATTKFALFFALLSVVSSELKSFAGERCKFELFKNDPPGFDGPTREIDWKQPFINNQMFKGKTLNNVNSNPIQVEELQIKVQNTIDKFSLTAEKNVRCAFILADKIQGARIEGRNLTGLDITGNVGIDGLTLKGKKVYDLKLNTFINASSVGNIRRTYISGETVEEVFTFSANSTENTINVDYASKLKLAADYHLGTTIRAKRRANEILILANDGMDYTHIESFHVDGVQVMAPSKANNTRINGTKVNSVHFAASVLNNLNIEGEMLEDVNVGGDFVDNVVLKAKTLENSYIGSHETLRNVDITVSDNIDDLRIKRGFRDVHNIKLNGVSIDFEGRFRVMQCSDKLGYPDDDADLKGSKNCFSEYCQSKCAGSGHETGKCFGRTCCCMKL